MWDTSAQIYPYASANPIKGDLYWRFPSGSTISFHHMENTEDRYGWLGASIPLICFDELATFTQDQFFFMLGSNRSTCGVKPYIRCTTNPEARTWLAQLLQWWWDEETGYPIKERSGKIRYFVRDKDQIIWSSDPEQLKRDYPGQLPKSFTFIPASVRDNKVLMEKDPGYLSNLLALGNIDRERFLYGNWKIDSSGGIIFKKEWFKIIPDVPHGIRNFCRFWDLAASEPEEGKDPDWTAGILMGHKDGQWVIVDIKRTRGSPSKVEALIKTCAEEDPQGTMIRMEQEPGASGLMVCDHFARHILVGYDFKGIPSRRNKVLRSKALSAAAEQGNVLLVRGPWNAAFLDEAENFKGENEKNDQIDGATGALDELKAGFGDWKFALPTEVGRYNPVTPVQVTGRYRPVGF